jgi:hypothetical protein
MRILLARTCAVAIIVVGARTRAAPDSAEDAIRRGVELRRQGDDERALQEFTKAYEASKTPRALAQIGLAEQALGRWVDAEAHVQDALKATSDPWIQKNRLALQDALDTIGNHLGTLEILGEPAGAEVRVQGQRIGQLPLAGSVRVPNGNIIVEVRHPGYWTTSRTVTISGGEVSRETIVLVPSTNEADVQRPRPAVATAGPAVPRDQSPEPDVRTGVASTGTPWQRPAKWAAAGLAVAAVGIGILETVTAVRKSNDFNSLPEMCTDDGNGHIGGGQRCEQVNHDQNVATWTAGISYGLGAILTTTAIVLQVTEPRSPGGNRSAALTCGASGWFTGVTCVAHW